MMRALNPKNASVLIVEDNPDDTFVVARALEAFGIRHVYAVDTAEEAINFLRTQPCDVALVDYNLPRMNGLMLLQRLGEAYPDLRIIVVTGARDDKIAASVLKSGAVDYVSKDEMLTSGIVRSLQQALREEFAANDARRQAAVEGASNGLTGAREEGEWLLETMEGSMETGVPSSSGPSEWLDLIQAFNRLLAESMQCFPGAAERAEDAVVRMLVTRGASPTDVLRAYCATLRTMAAAQQPMRVNPMLSLARVFAQMVAQYQEERSMDAAAQQA
jgi:CheY-like chemotaxis protein